MLGTADADALVFSTIYSYDPATETYTPITIAAAREMEPWECFMISALEAIELIFPEE